MTKHRGRISKHTDGRGGWRFEVDSVDPATGRRSRVVRTAFKTKGEAAAALETWRREKSDGRSAPARSARLDAYLGEWLTAVGPQLRPTTVALYRTIISAHVVPHIGGVKLANLDGATLTALYGRLLERLGKKTVRNVHGLLYKALSDAVEGGVIPSNPAERAKPPRVPKSAPKVWTGDQLGRFLASVEEDRLPALWRLLSTTGMRRGEVLGLRWESVDFDRATLSVVTQITEYGGTLFTSEPKTEAGSRMIALDPVTVVSLREHRKRQLEERLAWGSAYEDQGLVFCRVNGSPIRPALITATLPKLAAASGLPRLTPHGLRHSWASVALSQGIHPKVVSERLGHASIGSRSTFTAISCLGSTKQPQRQWLRWSTAGESGDILETFARLPTRDYANQPTGNPIRTGLIGWGRMPSDGFF